MVVIIRIFNFNFNFNLSVFFFDSDFLPDYLSFWGRIGLVFSQDYLERLHLEPLIGVGGLEIFQKLA